MTDQFIDYHGGEVSGASREEVRRVISEGHPELHIRKVPISEISEDIALYLLNNDIYASLGCKTVIIETVEREFVQHILSFRDIKDINYTLEKEDNKPENNFTEKKKKMIFLKL